jgi:hypothetical protein
MSANATATSGPCPGYRELIVLRRVGQRPPKDGHARPLTNQQWIDAEPSSTSKRQIYIERKIF